VPTRRIFVKFYFGGILINPVRGIQFWLKPIIVEGSSHVDLVIFMTTCSLANKVTMVVFVAKAAIVILLPWLQ